MPKSLEDKNSKVNMRNKTWEEPKYSCCFTPGREFHEVGCHHKTWEAKELQENLDNAKVEIDNLISELSLARKERDEQWMKAIEEVCKSYRGGEVDGSQRRNWSTQGYRQACYDIKQKMGGKE